MQCRRRGATRAQRSPLCAARRDRPAHVAAQSAVASGARAVDRRGLESSAVRVRTRPYSCLLCGVCRERQCRVCSVERVSVRACAALYGAVTPSTTYGDLGDRSRARRAQPYGTRTRATASRPRESGRRRGERGAESRGRDLSCLDTRADDRGRCDRGPAEAGPDGRRREPGGPGCELPRRVARVRAAVRVRGSFSSIDVMRSCVDRRASLESL